MFTRMRCEARRSGVRLRYTRVAPVEVTWACARGPTSICQASESVSSIPPETIMHVRERLSGWSTKAAHHAPGRLLLRDAKNGAARVVRFKRQVELGRLRHRSTHEQARVQRGVPR